MRVIGVWEIQEIKRFIAYQQYVRVCVSGCCYGRARGREKNRKKERVVVGP